MGGNPVIAATEPLAEWLRAIGIDLNLTWRVVIDAPIGAPVTVYVEHYGDTKTIELKLIG